MICSFSEDVVLYILDGNNISRAFKLKFFCVGNETGYEALIVRLMSVLQMGLRRLRLQANSKLITKQVNKEFALKEIILVPYRTVDQRLIKSFKHM